MKPLPFTRRAAFLSILAVFFTVLQAQVYEPDVRATRDHLSFVIRYPAFMSLTFGFRPLSVAFYRDPNLPLFVVKRQGKAEPTP